MLRSIVVAAVSAVVAAFAVVPAVQAQNIKIGIIGPMGFIQGEYHWAGAEMARDEINKAGGIRVGNARRMIEIVKADSNEMTSVPDATNAMERIITRDKVDFVVGGFRSEAVLAMQEVAMDNKKIFIGTGSTLSKLGQNVAADYNRYKYWFRLSPTKDTDLVRSVFAILGSVGEQIRRDLKKDTPKVAILAEKAAWTEAMVGASQKVLPGMKMEVVGVWQPSAVATDVTAELSAIERSGADVVYTLLSGPVGVVVGRQMGERNMKAVAFGINVEAQKDEFWAATAGKGQYVATVDTYSDVEMTPKTLAFMKAFRDRYKKAPTYTAQTYDALYILKDAIEKAASIDADKVVPVIEQMEHVGTGSTVTWDKQHDPIWAVGKTAGIGVQWQNGKKVPFWPPQIKGMQSFAMPK